ncbi:MAG: hypothetical protein RSC41_07050, partial [Oscillospiraceae bacterium]
AVLNYFEAQIQIEPSKLISTGFGKNFPIAQNDTEEGRRQNRRVELVIVSSEIGGATPQEMMSILSNNYEIEEYNEMNDIAGVIEEEAEKDIQDIGQTAETQGETTADVE